MPTVYKVLGQSAPAATTNTDLYTVPASTSAIVSTLVITNRGTGAQTFRVAIRPAGATIANQHYIAYDANIINNNTITLTIGMTLATTDKVTVYASSTDLSFSLFGTEVS